MPAQNFNPFGGGVLVGDMFGSINDNPLLRMAREEQYNRAQAEEEIKARTAPQALRPWETPEGIAEETNLRWNVPLARPGVQDVRSSGGNIFERNPLTGDWGLAASAPLRPGAQSNKVQDIDKYAALLAAADVEFDGVKKSQLLEQAAILKAILEKAGKFAPPKPPMLTTTDSVRTERNPLYFGGTNTPPSLSFTNTSSRLTSPASPFDLGLRMGMGGTNSAPAAPSSGLREGQRVRNRTTGRMGTVKNGVVVPD